MDNVGDESHVTSEGRANASWKTPASRFLLVLFCVTLVLSVLSIWARNQVTDTDRYVRTVSPLARDPEIQNALADRIAERVSAQLDASVTLEILPEGERFLAAPLALLLEEYVHEIAMSVLASDGFADLWEQINRAAHPAISAVLTGREGETSSLEDGRITVDIEPLLTSVIDRLREQGVDVVDRIRLDRVDTSFVLFESDDIARIQRIVGWVERLAIVLPIVSLASLVAAFVLASERRRTVVLAGIGTAVSMVLLIVALVSARWWSIGHLPPDVDSDAAVAFFNTLTAYMRRGALGIMILGLVIAGVAAYGDWRRREDSVPLPS